MVHSITVQVNPQTPTPQKKEEGKKHEHTRGVSYHRMHPPASTGIAGLRLLSPYYATFHSDCAASSSVVHQYCRHANICVLGHHQFIIACWKVSKHPRAAARDCCLKVATILPNDSSSSSSSSSVVSKMLAVVKALSVQQHSQQQLRQHPHLCCSGRGGSHSCGTAPC